MEKRRWLLSTTPTPRPRSAVWIPWWAEGLRREIVEIRRTGIAFDRNEHTPGISAAAIARRALGDNVIAISVPAPTARFLEKEQRIIAALRAAADSPDWTR